MTFYGGVQGGKKKKWLDFGSGQDHHADCPIGNLALTQQIMSGFLWYFLDSSTMIQGTIDCIFLSDLPVDHHVDSPNRESGQYGG